MKTPKEPKKEAIILAGASAPEYKECAPHSKAIDSINGLPILEHLLNE